MSAFEFAALTEEDGSAVIQEVAIYFEYELLRGIVRTRGRRMNSMPLARLIIRHLPVAAYA